VFEIERSGARLGVQVFDVVGWGDMIRLAQRAALLFQARLKAPETPGEAVTLFTPNRSYKTANEMYESLD
jgi:hypothetical protein